MYRLISLPLICILIMQCSPMKTDMVLTKADSPHQITEDVEIEIGYKLIIEAGAEVIISNGVSIISFGDVLIEGTSTDPIIIRAENPSPGWGTLKLKGEAKKFVIKHATISDGTITSYNTNNHFSEVHFTNTQDLNWEWAIARFWYGQVLIENCTAKGVNKAEGFLLHDVNDAIVRHCRFETVPDGVEFINCDRGLITENVFQNSNDDAIDLNGCNAITISNNQISGIADAAMEIGSENFGSSLDITVESNKISGCDKGIFLKEASSAQMTGDTLNGNKFAFHVTTPADSIRVSQATIARATLTGNDEDFYQDDRSQITIIE